MQNFLQETERDIVDGLGWLSIFMTIWVPPCKVSSCCFAVGSGSTLVSKTITLKTGSNEIVKVMTWPPSYSFLKDVLAWTALTLSGR